MKCPLVSLIFLKRSLIFPILLFSSISFHWSLKKAFLYLFAILWNSAFRWIYISFSPLPFASFLSNCELSSDNHFAFLHFFFLGMILFTAPCTMSNYYLGCLNSCCISVFPLRRIGEEQSSSRSSNSSTFFQQVKYSINCTFPRIIRKLSGSY